MCSEPHNGNDLDPSTAIPIHEGDPTLVSARGKMASIATISPWGIQNVINDANVFMFRREMQQARYVDGGAPQTSSWVNDDEAEGMVCRENRPDAINRIYFIDAPEALYGPGPTTQETRWNFRMRVLFNDQIASGVSPRPANTICNVSVSFRQLFIFVVVVSWVERRGAVGGSGSVARRLRHEVAVELLLRLCISSSLSILFSRCD